MIDGVGIFVVVHRPQPFSPFLPLSAVPGAPPQMVNAYPESSTSLRIVWEPPPENKQNGVIAYYKIFYVPKTRSDSEATVIEIKNANAREFVIDELMKWAGYRVWMLAGTSVGDGPKSSPIEIQTDEDGTYPTKLIIHIIIWSLDFSCLSTSLLLLLLLQDSNSVRLDILSSLSFLLLLLFRNKIRKTRKRNIIGWRCMSSMLNIIVFTSTHKNKIWSRNRTFPEKKVNFGRKQMNALPRGAWSVQI